MAQSAQDLAQEALAAVKNNPVQTSSDEAADSDNLAETISSLQNIIERNAVELQKLQEALKEKRESLKSVFENDTQLTEVKQQVDTIADKVKERKAQLQNSPQSTSLKVAIGELNEQKKELEETLSNHLINYYGLTNSTSFDTSDGDQWEFRISAKVKSRR